MAGNAARPEGARVRVFAPATVANVACAFDVLGFALEQPGDEVVLTRRARPGIEISSISGDEGRLPRDPARNTAAVSINALLKQLNSDAGFVLELRKKMPLGSGLGSSAASAAAGVAAANRLLGSPFSPAELLPFAMEGERIACGAAHADNVAPSLIGGFVLVRSYSPLDTVRLESPPDLCAAVVHPHIEIRTEDARRILKRDIPLKSAVIQWGNIGGLIAGLLKGDYDLIGRSLQDVVIEPERSMLIPGFQQVKSAALAAGALGCSISGSGPSIFALARGAEAAEAAGNAMAAEFRKLGIDADIHLSPINRHGATVIDDE